MWPQSRLGKRSRPVRHTRLPSLGGRRSPRHGRQSPRRHCGENSGGETIGQLHGASKQLLAGIAPEPQARIAKVAAPGVDWDTAKSDTADDPTAHFAQAEIGRALRDRVLSPEGQRAIRLLAHANGANPDVAMRIAEHAVGADAIQGLGNVLQGGKIEQGKAAVLRNMGLLHPSDPANPRAPLHVTSDALPLLPPGIQKAVALRPELFRYTDAAATPGDALHKIAENGQQRYADTARLTLGPEGASAGNKGGGKAGSDPAAAAMTEPDETPGQQSISRESSRPLDLPSKGAQIVDSVKSARDAIASNLADLPRAIFEARMRGESPDEIAASHGFTWDQAEKLSDQIANHVAGLLESKGIDPSAARDAVTRPTFPNESSPEHSRLPSSEEAPPLGHLDPSPQAPVRDSDDSESRNRHPNTPNIGRQGPPLVKLSEGPISDVSTIGDQLIALERKHNNALFDAQTEHLRLQRQLKEPLEPERLAKLKLAADEAGSRLKALNRERLEEARSLFELPRSQRTEVGFDPTDASKSDSNLMNSYNEAWAWLGKVAHRDVLKGRNVIAKNENTDRPKINGTLFIDGKYMGPADVLHEVGHIIEARQPAILRRSLEFRNRRTAGETPQALGGKYEPDEVALPDRWVELGGDLYSGKVYRDKSGRDTASEILSMGLERLYKDPTLFHSTDPEYFDFIVNSLRNTHQ